MPGSGFGIYQYLFVGSRAMTVASSPTIRVPAISYAVPGPSRQFVGRETVIVTGLFVGKTNEAIAEGVPEFAPDVSVRVGVSVFGRSSGIKVGVDVNVTLAVTEGKEVAVTF